MKKKTNIKMASTLLALSILLTATSCSLKDRGNTKEKEELPRTTTEEEYDSNNIEEKNNNETIEENNNIIEINNFAYLTCDTPLYDEELNEIDYIDKYQKVSIIKENNNITYVAYYRGVNNIEFGYIPVDSYEILPSLFVEVDISDQIVNMYIDKEVLLTTDTVTGKTSTPTREGYFGITYKEYDTYLRGSDYCSHVDYWMPFDGGIGLHDADWRDTFGGDIYINYGSHGCVNLPKEAAKTIYENVEAGSKVLVHK